MFLILCAYEQVLQCLSRSFVKWNGRTKYWTWQTLTKQIVAPLMTQQDFFPLSNCALPLEVQKSDRFFYRYLTCVGHKQANPPKKLSGIHVQIEKKLPYLGALKTDSHRKHETVLRPWIISTLSVAKERINDIISIWTSKNNEEKTMHLHGW